VRFNMSFDFSDPYASRPYRPRFKEDDALYNEPVGDYIIPRPAGYWEQYTEKLTALRAQCDGTVDVVLLQNGKFSVRCSNPDETKYADPCVDRLDALTTAATQWGG
jgi:hypothetical protein